MFFSAQTLAKREKKLLAPYAVLSFTSAGRKYPEVKDETRLCFQKDRDRIIHSRAFRRLKSKTQVFVAHYGDHYRTRLTHSLEVAQISRDLARSLGLNEDLVEAIALAHDLGHTPFGHCGENALDKIMRNFGLNFEHNEQSKRIVEILEQVYPNFPGLNLSYEVLEGLMKHQTSWDKEGVIPARRSLESEVVNLADEIAYQNHDLDDGLRAEILKLSEVKKLYLWQKSEAMVSKKYGKLTGQIYRSRVISNLIGLMINDVLKETERRLKKYKIKTLEDVYQTKAVKVGFSSKISAENRKLKEFLRKNLYCHPTVLKISNRGERIIKTVFNKFYQEVSLLPKSKRLLISSGEKKELVIKDYLAGMTDDWMMKIGTSEKCRFL